MITLSNVRKVYKERNSVAVTALRDVSLELPDKGLVFILGKSGSGKSTLLNILGGLDGFNIGDMVVDGVSVKDFKERDFDRYRNEYVGFVFQDFNLLNNYSAGKNLALAMELQGKEQDDELISQTLEKVGLGSYANRSTRTLSGGEKQRVAIARALIKSPKLILADEPTGSLDEATGKEIFNLLKDLSSDRLVVIVSHDSASAETYGDRIITLRDGKIDKVEFKKEIENDERVKYEPSKIENGKRRKKGFVKYAAQLGVRAALNKKIRLIASVVLLVVTLTFVGVGASTYKNLTDSRMLSAHERYGLYNFNINTRNIEKNQGGAPYAAAEKFENEHKNTLLKRYFHIKYSSWNFSFGQNMSSEVTKEYYYRGVRANNEYSFVGMNETELNQFGLKMAYGRLPENSHELAITKYLFDLYKHFNFVRSDGTEKIVTTYDDLIGETMEPLSPFQAAGSVIVGVVDTGLDYDYYKPLKTLSSEDVTRDESSIIQNFNAEFSDESIHNKVFVYSGLFNYSDYGFDMTLYDTKYSGGLLPIENQPENTVIVSQDYEEDDNVIIIPSRMVSSYLNWKLIVEKDYEWIVDLLGEDFDPAVLYNPDINLATKICEIMAKDSRDINYTNYASRDEIKSNKKYTKTVKIIGFYMSGNDAKLIYSNIADTVGLESDKVADFSTIDGYYGRLGQTDSEKLEFVSKNYNPVIDGYEFEYISPLHDAVDFFEQTSESMVFVLKYLLIAGIALSLFVMILLFSAIMLSIKKEVAIIRAMGASKKDVLLILFFSAMMVAAISVVLAWIITYICIELMYGYGYILPKYYILPIEYSVVTIVAVLGMGIGLSLLASVSGIIEFLKSKPVDIIRKAQN